MKQTLCYCGMYRGVPVCIVIWTQSLGSRHKDMPMRRTARTAVPREPRTRKSYVQHVMMYMYCRSVILRCLGMRKNNDYRRFCPIVVHERFCIKF